MDILFLLTYPLDLAHAFFLWFPVIIYFKKFPIRIIKIMTLILSLTPLSWYFFGDRCAVSILSSTMLGEKAKGNSFSRKYFEGFYKAVQKVFGYEEGKKGFSLAIYTHWIINISLMWYYVFFVDCKC